MHGIYAGWCTWLNIREIACVPHCQPGGRRDAGARTGRIHFLFLPLLPAPAPKHETTLSLYCLSAVANRVWQYCTSGNLTIFDKDRNTMETNRKQLKFLQPSIGVRYDCHVQLVAIRRSWMCTEFETCESGSWSCTWLYHLFPLRQLPCSYFGVLECVSAQGWFKALWPLRIQGGSTNCSDAPLSKSVRITADLSLKLATESTQIFTKLCFVEPLRS